jgi:hypothetical protein
MGIQRTEAQLFYAFDLESNVRADHLLREIIRFLDIAAAPNVLRSVPNSFSECWSPAP